MTIMMYDDYGGSDDDNNDDSMIIFAHQWPCHRIRVHKRCNCSA